MRKLTPEGEQIVANLADQYRIGTGAVKAMLNAVANGGGTMAQFDLPELGGNGQWMRGGMTMVGDMFNNSLKVTVDNLCNDLSNLIANQPNFYAPVAQYQSQSQGSGSYSGEGVSLFVPQSQPSFTWWPSELGNPSSTGSQNSMRYAYFPGSNRLAIDTGNGVTIYDTAGHNIQGFGQQQSGDASLSFTSQRGLVRVDSLPRAYTTERVPAQSMEQAPAKVAEAASPNTAGTDASSILALIEQLGGLKEKGILTEEEFAAKKAELLKRL